MNDEIGVVHGRFQLLHNDHVKYILKAYERCDHLIIGICNPDYLHTGYSVENPHRSLQSENPFSYYERFRMIKGTMQECGISLDKFDVVPFPINVPELIFNYAPKEATYYLTIYDAWGYRKKELLESLGCKTRVLWEITIDNKGISGRDVRQRIKNGQEWKQYVPNYVYKYVIDNRLDKLII